MIWSQGICWPKKKIILLGDHKWTAGQDIVSLSACSVLNASNPPVIAWCLRSNLVCLIRSKCTWMCKTLSLIGSQQGGRPGFGPGLPATLVNPYPHDQRQVLTCVSLSGVQGQIHSDVYVRSCPVICRGQSWSAVKRCAINPRFGVILPSEVLLSSLVFAVVSIAWIPEGFPAGYHMLCCSIAID